MSVIISKKRIESISDKEDREFFYEEHIENGLPIQIRELRKQRRMNQTQLAAEVGCDQSNISDWENPNYEYTPQIGTLKRLANAFDVPLIVRFGSWQELLEWDITLSHEKVTPVSFDEFKEIERTKRVDVAKRKLAEPPKKRQADRNRASEATTDAWLPFADDENVVVQLSQHSSSEDNNDARLISIDNDDLQMLPRAA